MNTQYQIILKPEQIPVHDTAIDAPCIDLGGHTDIGRIRTTHEECFITADLTRSLVLGPSSLALSPGTPWFGGSQGKLLVVADGISGAGGAKLASSVAVRTLGHYVTSIMPWIVDIDDEDVAQLKQDLEGALERCQRRIRAEARRHGYDDGMPVGTTMTIAYIVWPGLYIFHVGDSRAFLYREQQLIQLTWDDTMARGLVERGVLSPEAAKSSFYSRILTNAVGGSVDEICVEFHRHDLQLGDQILLCTNGLTRHFSNDEIAEHLEVGVTAQRACQRLVAFANARGGEDNITAAVARIERQSPREMS